MKHRKRAAPDPETPKAAEIPAGWREVLNNIVAEYPEERLRAVCERINAACAEENNVVVVFLLASELASGCKATGLPKALALASLDFVWDSSLVALLQYAKRDE